MTIEFSSNDVVQDAMRQGFAKVFMDNVKDTDSLSNDPVELAKAVTFEQCTNGAKETITTLYKRHKGMFQKMFMLGTEIQDTQKFRNTHWPAHIVFLLQDNAGIWYSGNPTNLTDDEARSTDFTYITDKDLKQLLLKIRATNGGDWPELEFIEDSKKQLLPFIDPSSSNKDRSKILIPLIYMDEDSGTALTML